MHRQVLETRVASNWVDYNGHMNDAEYARVFSLAVEAFMKVIGLDEAGRSQHQTTIFTLETHLCYLAEASEGDALKVDIDILDRDAKRLHVLFTLKSVDDELVATSEQMLMAMGTDSGRPTPLPEPVEQAVADYGQLAPADWPKQAQRVIGIRRKS